MQHIRVFGNQARGVEKHAHGAIAQHTAAFLAFAQNSGCHHIARQQFIHKALAQAVDQMGAGRAHGFGNQRAGQMRRVRHAGGVVLERIHVAQLGAHAVSHHQTIGGGTIVVGSGKALQMQTAAAAAGQHHRFGVHDQQFAPLQIIEHRAHAAAVLIGEQFDGGAAVELGDAALELDGFAQHAHHFQAGEIAIAQHARDAGTAGAFALQASVVVGAGG